MPEHDSHIHCPARALAPLGEVARRLWEPLARHLREAWLDLCMDERSRYLSQSTCAADFERRQREWNESSPRRAWQRLRS